MAPDEDNPALEQLLHELKATRGFDFTGYKRATLARRIQRRMADVEITDLADYARYLETAPDEHAALFNTILINVTAFFRDPEAWSFLAGDVVPRILRDAAGRSHVRVWSAGCASGEEAYSIAMVLAEAMGPVDFARRAKIYATDWDSDALAQARRARYPVERIEAVPQALREKYFTIVGDTAVLDATLRRAVTFGPHDLTENPPISRLDLLLCRNTLMYFNAATQGRVLARLHFALSERGFLFLGRAEMLLSHLSSFTPHDLRQRVFVKHPQSHAGMPWGSGSDDKEAMNGPSDPQLLLANAALDVGPVAQIVLDANERLTAFNQRARTMLRLGTPDLGRQLQDLEVSYRPADLRSLLDRARVTAGPCTVEARRPLPNGETEFLEIVLTPLVIAREVLGFSFTFDDVSRNHRLQEHLHSSSESLETAYEELQSSNEELETTNEELQSSNEELETTNEELQAASEEMETINEELQSTNEELTTVNERLRVREGELDGANGFLQAILGSLQAGVVVVDESLAIQVWNQRAEDLWGLRADEVRGQRLPELDIGLPVAELEAPMRASLCDGQVARLVLDAVNRRGRAVRCLVTISPLPDAAPMAVTLTMDVLPEREVTT